MTGRDDDQPTCSCKVGRAIERYDLGELNAEIVSRRREDDASLRELATHVNCRVLDAALREADADSSDSAYGAISDGDAVAAMYEALDGDEAEAERTARVRTRLEQAGVDIAGVRSDWVTHPTVRSHLRNCLNVDTSRSSTIDRGDARNTIEWARTRCASVVERTVERLVAADLLSLGSVDVTVTIQVTCTECGDAFRSAQLLDSPECSCRSETGRGSSP